MDESLTRLLYLRIFALLAQCNEPLSSQQINNELKQRKWIEDPTSENKDIFRKLKKLVPEYYEFDKRTFLFIWNKLLYTNNNDCDKYILLGKIKCLFELDWNLGIKKGKSYIINNIITFINKSENKDTLLLFIEYGKYSSVRIKVNLLPQGGSSISFWNGDEKKQEKEIICKVNGNDTLIYLKKQNKRKTRFLDVTLSEKAKRKHVLIDKYWKYIQGIEIHDLLNKLPTEAAFEISNDLTCGKIISDRTYWKYSINLRGFLLYLLAELLHTKKKNTKVLRNVVSSKAILQIAPFLLYHQDLERVGFNIIRVLKEIATEFQHELDYNSQPQIRIKDKDSYLLHKVTERYFAKVEGYFNVVKQTLMAAILPEKIGVEEYADIRYKINEYRLHILTLLKKWTEDQLEYINSSYGYYHEEYERLYNPYVMLIRRQQQMIKNIYRQIIRYYCYLWTSSMNNDLIMLLCTLGFIY